MTPSLLAKPDHKVVGKRLADARDRAGLTQVEAGALFGVDGQTISKRERGVLGISAAEHDRMMKEYESRMGGKRLDEIVLQGTSARVSEPAARYDPGAHRGFLFELARAGATDAELEVAESAVTSPHAPLIEEETLYEGVRAMVNRWIELRRAPAEPPVVRDAPVESFERMDVEKPATSKRKAG